VTAIVIIVIIDVGRIVAEAAQAKGLELLVDCSPDVPSALVGDPVRVQQVLLNLASNAVKFTAHGEVVVRVRLITSDERRAHVRFEVSDTGIGIAQADQERLFTAVQQAHSSTIRRFGGTGLGLAICRQPAPGTAAATVDSSIRPVMNAVEQLRDSHGLRQAPRDPTALALIRVQALTRRAEQEQRLRRRRSRAGTCLSSRTTR
jgi:light-regulated signal transduction histidine kinase (bacteriophytochrome)